MTITTTQVTADEALRAVADGKSVQMIWTDDDKLFFSDFTTKIKDAMAIGEAFLIVEVKDDDNTEKIASSQQKIADNCENAAEEIHPEPEPKPSVLENFKEVKFKQTGGRKPLDDGKIIALFKAGWPSRKIADEMGVQTNAINVHLRKLREEGRL